MNKTVQAGLLALSIALVSAGTLTIVQPSVAVAAAKQTPVRKMDAGVFKKKLAEVAKASSAVKKQQNALLTKLQSSQASLVDDFRTVLGDQADVGYTDEELTVFYQDLLTKLSNADPTIGEYFLPDELDQLSYAATGWLANDKQADMLIASYKKLTTTYNTYVSQKKYQEALNVRNQQIGLDKKMNVIYSTMLNLESDLSSVVQDVLAAEPAEPDASDDGSGSVWDDVYDDGGNSSGSVWDDVYND